MGRQETSPADLSKWGMGMANIPELSNLVGWF
jgi:hypothetical protein